MNEENNAPIVPQEKKSSTLKSILKEVVIFAIIAFGIVLPFRYFIAEPYVVSGESMSPTFESGDYLIVEKISVQNKNLKRNDVIVFNLKDPTFKTDSQRNLIKRIIGLPEETVKMKGSQITIINDENPDGLILDETFIVNKSQADFTVILGKDEYFVMGDNRPKSYDSRSWGTLKEEEIIGKPIIRLLPIQKISFWPGKIN